MIRLIVGLGNPGKSYERTRHNAGAWFIQGLCKEYHTALLQKSSFQAQYTNLFLTEALNIHLAIPTTFMNSSGSSVGSIARYFKVSPQEMLIVHDELDFPVGTAKLKRGGGLGGHNGLRDIVRVLGSHDFWRLRIGIGHPGSKEKVPQYVLNIPQRLEYDKIQEAIQAGIMILPDFCSEKTEKAIQILHSE